MMQQFRKIQIVNDDKGNKCTLIYLELMLCMKDVINLSYFIKYTDLLM